MKPDDIVELPDGRRLMVVSPERACEICKDVQMWFWRTRAPRAQWEQDYHPSFFRGVHWIPADFPWPVAIEIDSPKPEYEPCDDSSSPP